MPPLLPLWPPCMSALGLYGPSYTATMGVCRPHGPRGSVECQPSTYTALASPQPSPSAHSMPLRGFATSQPSAYKALAAPRPPFSADTTFLVARYLSYFSLYGPCFTTALGVGRLNGSRGFATCQPSTYTAPDDR